MLEGIEVRTGTDYFSDRSYYDGIAEKIIDSFEAPISEISVRCEADQVRIESK